MRRTFGAEFQALTREQQSIVAADWLDAWHEDGCTPAAYRWRIGDGNLAAYVRCLTATVA